MLWPHERKKTLRDVKESIDLYTSHCVYINWNITVLLEQDGAEDTVTQLVESLPSTHEALSFISALHKLDVVLHTCNLSSQEVEAAGSGVQGHPWLHKEFENNLGYMRLCLKKKKQNMQGIELYVKYMPWCKLTYTSNTAVVDLHLPVDLNKMPEGKIPIWQTSVGLFRERGVRCFPGELSSRNHPLLASRKTTRGSPRAIVHQ